MSAYKIFILSFLLFSFSTHIAYAISITKSASSQLGQSFPNFFVKKFGNPISIWIKTIILGVLALLYAWPYLTAWKIFFQIIGMLFLGPPIGAILLMLIMYLPVFFNNIGKTMNIWFWLIIVLTILV